MRKRIKLRLELVIFMLLSLVLSLTVFISIRNLGFLFHKNSESQRLEKLYSESIGPLEDGLRKCDTTQDMDELLNQDYHSLVGYEFYIVDQNGIVRASTNSGIKNINEDQIRDGLRIYEPSNKDENVFKATGCDYIDNDLYLYYVYLRYDESDTGMLIVALIGALVCYFFMIWGRVSYISKIRSSVEKIASGDLSQRVVYHYNNELRGLAEDINSMAESLESEEQKKNEFLTNISHDIRTPLTTILGYLDMIKHHKYDSEEEIRHYMEVMERKGQFLASMLEDFFQYSKFASGDIKLNIQKFELNELLRQMMEDEVNEFEKNQLHLQLNLYSRPIYCEGDIELLARVVYNLLGNTLKYAKKDTTVILTTDIKNEKGVTYACFHVENVPKKEISSNEIELLFERLYKRDDARKEEGSGLGLSIAKSIVALHDGKITGELINGKLVIKVLLKQTGHLSL